MSVISDDDNDNDSSSSSSSSSSSAQSTEGGPQEGTTDTVGTGINEEEDDEETSATTQTKKLYNRENDIRKLVEAYDNRHSNHLVLSVGPAGVGKTCLIQRLRHRVMQHEKGCFVQGRYDDLDHPEPFAPWLDMAEQLMEQLIDHCTELELASIMKSLQQSMELSDLQALAILIPLLGDLMDLTPTRTTTKMIGTTGRHDFLFTFANFLNAISHTSRPMVWFLDNVHNADATSLQVLKLLLAGNLPNMLTIIAFRPVSTEHPTSIMLQSLESAGIGMVPILPTAIDEASIQEWLDSYRMEITTEQRTQIASTIAKGTDGIALAIHLCLSIMNWNQDIVKATGGTPLQGGGDITTLFRLLYQMLPSDCQKVCLTASCMGTVIDVPHLAEIVTCDLPTALVQAEQHGILTFHYYSNPSQKTATEEQQQQQEEAAKEALTSKEEESPAALPASASKQKASGELHDLQLGYYQFVSTTYRELLHNIMTPDERMLKHTAIANVFRQNVERVGIFRVVVHMAMASTRLAPKAKELLVTFCLEAGRRASHWSDFVSAARYFQTGISLLVDCSPKWWKSHTSLIVDLYCDTAEVANALGKQQEMQALLAQAFHQAKEPSHRLRATKIQIQTLSSQNRMEIIMTGLKGLQKNHEPIKKNAASNLETELKSVRKLLQNDGKSHSEDDGGILNQSAMIDARHLGAMEVMNLMIAPALLIQEELVPVLAARMVRLSYKHGIANVTPLALCLLGVVLALEDEVELGVWCSDTGVTLVEQMNDKSYKGRVMTIHWGLLSRFVKPWRICQEPLKLGYRTCIKGGDTEFALICPVISTLNMLASGGALPPIGEAMKSVYQLLQRKDEDALQRILRPFYQLILNLMGVSPETTSSVLTGTIMREEDDLRYIQEHPNESKTIECCLMWCQAMIQFYMHKFGKAREWIEKCHDQFHRYPHVFLGSLQIPLEFWNAMTAIRLLWKYQSTTSDGSSKKWSSAEKKRQSSLETTAENSLQTLKQLSSHADENVQHKVLMVEGELQALEGEVEQAMESFQRAIALAEEYGSIGDKALFCEQAGLTLRLCSKEDPALDYLEDCCTSYRAWGALIKVNHVKGTVIPEAVYEWED